MEWIQLIAILIAVFSGIKWIISELKIYQTQADKDRKQLLQLVRNIEKGAENLHKKTDDLHKETENMHKNLCPAEKRHFR